MAGRRPKSSADHKRDGTFRADRHGNRADLKLPPATNREPPEDMAAEGKELWHRVVESMPKESFTLISREGLVAYCEAWLMLRLVTPIAFADPSDKNKRIAWKSAIETVDKLGRQFGWTPSAAASIKTQPVDNEQPSDFEKWLNRSKEIN